MKDPNVKYITWAVDNLCDLSQDITTQVTQRATPAIKQQQVRLPNNGGSFKHKCFYGWTSETPLLKRYWYISCSPIHRVVKYTLCDVYSMA